MTAGTVLALWAADDADAATTAEFARVATAAAAAGLPVALVDLREDGARRTPASDGLQRHLDALASAGAPLRRLAPTDLRAALRDARSVLRLGSPRRAAQPALLEVTDAWVGATGDADLLRGLRVSGQVVRV